MDDNFFNNISNSLNTLGDTILDIQVKIKTIDSNEFLIQLNKESKIEELKRRIENVKYIFLIIINILIFRFLKFQ